MLHAPDRPALFSASSQASGRHGADLRTVRKGANAAGSRLSTDDRRATESPRVESRASARSRTRENGIGGVDQSPALTRDGTDPSGA